MEEGRGGACFDFWPQGTVGSTEITLFSSGQKEKDRRPWVHGHGLWLRLSYEFSCLSPEGTGHVQDCWLSRPRLWSAAWPLLLGHSASLEYWIHTLPPTLSSWFLTSHSPRIPPLHRHFSQLFFFLATRSHDSVGGRALLNSLSDLSQSHVNNC